ncbi:hypothetical protein NDU88_005230 [Pleurodeles waltl]|uniref:Uncharacterized protein n=1 Tax=Pleurodeles waltl TaxID=8319 RepID=A0AAV7V7B5_PLEWA|nr:hypothetical protein NDU88_005230 [Pleurodeles waltl]
MGCKKDLGGAHANNLDKYTVLLRGKEVEKDLPTEGIETKGGQMERNPSLHKIMNAIQLLRITLEPILDVNLHRTDLQKVTDKVTTAEMEIHGPQAATKRLEDHVKVITKLHAVVAVKLEDQEGLDRRNNIQVMGIPEKGPSAEPFMEYLILHTCCVQRDCPNTSP